MNLLIVSATFIEIKGLIERFNFKNFNNNLYNIIIDNNCITILISGIGIANISYSLTKHLSLNKYDFIFNSGICGSFSRNLKLGDIVNITSEQFADFGIDDNGIFKTFFDIDVLDKNIYPFKNGVLINETKVDFFPEIGKLKKVTSISVNTASGFEKNIQKIFKKFNPDVENMEGAAFYNICMLENLPFFEIRTISNFVENRNRNNWKFDLAINNLNDFFISLIESLTIDKK